MSDRIKTFLVNSSLIIVLAVLIFAAGTWWRMHTQFNAGEEAFRKGDFAGAVAGYESALHMYIPFHPTMEKAAQKLWTIGEINERLGDMHRALIAYRALRSSFYSARWLTTPGTQWIDRCDRKIAALVLLQRER